MTPYPVEEVVVDTLRKDSLPDRLADLIPWLQQRYDHIPAEQRDDATVSLDVSSEWDCHYAYMIISYYRPESEQEMIARKLEDERQLTRDLGYARETLRQLEERVLKNGHTSL
jgi:hypothetical protein